MDDGSGMRRVFSWALRSKLQKIQGLENPRPEALKTQSGWLGLPPRRSRILLPASGARIAASALPNCRDRRSNLEHNSHTRDPPIHLPSSSHPPRVVCQCVNISTAACKRPGPTESVTRASCHTTRPVASDSCDVSEESATPSVLKFSG